MIRGSVPLAIRQEPDVLGVSKRQLSRLSVMDAGQHTFCVGGALGVKRAEPNMGSGLFYFGSGPYNPPLPHFCPHGGV
jgi:hypothetical protein